MLDYVQPYNIYQFKFDTKFDSLNGTYRVLSIMSYGNLLMLDIDIKKILYTPLEINDSIFNEHAEKFETCRIFKLENITNTDIIHYVPEFIIKSEPQFDMTECKHIGLAINLGIWEHKNQLELLKTEIEDLVMARLGEYNLAVLYEIDTVLLAPGSYSEIQGDRKNARTNNNTLYKSKEDLKMELLKSEAKVAALEEVIENIVNG